MDGLAKAGVEGSGGWVVGLGWRSEEGGVFGLEGKEI